ncbi:hypothetical protein Tco_0848372 [Tanacetum coccineum]
MFHQDQNIIDYLHATTITQQQLHPTTIIQHELHANHPFKSKEFTNLTTVMDLHLFYMDKVFKLNYSTPTSNNQGISSNPRNRQIAQPGMNLVQDRQMQMVRGNVGNQFRQYVGQNVRNQVVQNAVQNPTRADGNANGNNEAHIQIHAKEFDLMAVVKDLDEIEEDDQLELEAKSHEELCFSNTSKTSIVSKSISIPNEEFSDDTTPSVARKFLNEDEIYPIVNQVGARVQNFEIQFLKKVAKFVRDFKSLANEADESLAKNKDLEFEIEHLLRAVVSQDIMPIVQNPTVVETSNLHTELERMKERFEICIIKKENEMITKFGMLVPLKVVETNDLLNPVTSNSVPTPQESKVVKNDKVIALGMFRINPFKTSKEEKSVPNKPIKSSVRTKPITVSQPHVITKKDVNSNSNSLSSKGVDNTSKTRRPQPRSNTNNDRVPYTSKSRCIKNKEVKVEEHPRNLLLSKNRKFGHLNMFMVRRLRMFKAYDKKSKASYKFHLEVLGNRPL